MKSLGISIGVSILLLFTGCNSTQPSKSTFRPNHKHIIFENGKAYRIPYRADYVTLENKDTRLYFQQLGFNCRSIDIGWESVAVINAFEKASDVYAKDTVGKEAARNGEMGCSRPLSNKEYAFYREKETQQAASRSAYLNYSAATATRTVNYNVQHSGSIYHY